jgi:hypothetical protein
MKTIYLVKYNNGEEFEDYEEFTFKYCYSSKRQANRAIEELKQDKDFLENVNCDYPERVDFWIEEVELVD